MRRIKAGIYQIKSKINNKIYIGSSSYIPDRRYEHFYKLRLNKHANIILQNHYNKYGKDDLVFEVLEYCDLAGLIIKENEYITNLRPTFNIRKIAESNLGWNHSEESKEKIRLARIGSKNHINEFILNPRKAAIIRAIYEKNRRPNLIEIAKIFDVSKSTIQSITSNRNWKIILDLSEEDLAFVNDIKMKYKNITKLRRINYEEISID